MAQSEAEELAFFGPFHAGGGGGHGDALQADHLAYDAAARVGRGHQSTGFKPIRVAVTTWSDPNNAFAEVSLPVRNTPSQPSSGLKNGKVDPVPAITSPSVVVAPGVIHQVSQGDDAGDGQQRQLELVAVAQSI